VISYPGRISTLAEPLPPPPAAPAPSLLRTTGLSHQYPDGTIALRDLSIDVPRGSVGLVGANGAGKTTLFRLLLGQLIPSAGSVEVVGRRVADDPVGIRRRLGYMPEHDCLPNDQSAADLVSTLGELAGLPSEAARQRASDVLDLVGLDESRFRPVGGFSTGMRQRAKLAQALVADPELILLDEPTAGLDPVGREEMLDLVARLAGFGVSVLFATHLLDDVQRVCDQVVMIDAGKLVVAGPIDELVQRTGVVRVEVGGQPDAVEQLAAALTHRGLAPVPVDAHLLDIDATQLGEEVYDTVRDAVADLGLRLYALSSRHHSLDELFVQEAQRP
jgi:ABC-2 type transport system ATP-binding protein